METVRRLLDYWYALEFFAPFWPQNTTLSKEIKDSNHLSWDSLNSYFEAPPPRSKNRPIVVASYDVYFGKIKSSELVNTLITQLKLDEDLEKLSDESCCICGFKVNRRGEYVAGSFALSRYIWAVAKIKKEQSLDIELNPEKLDKLNSQFNELISNLPQPLNKDVIRELYFKLLKLVRLDYKDFPFSILFIPIPEKSEKAKKIAAAIDESESTEMLDSFYLLDINDIRSKVESGDRLVKYINALKDIPRDRMEIDRDVVKMQYWMNPEHQPLGKWPSGHNPSLMQQMAINIAISDNCVGDTFSVNGPPGTGKTTLLKEIVAALVVKRAMVMWEYGKPDNAFKEEQFEYPPNKSANYFRPDDKLCQFGMLVVSNNNGAIENVSKELPLAQSVSSSLSGLFEVNEDTDVYFSSCAENLLDGVQPCWGLISATLGKKSNLSKMSGVLWKCKNNLPSVRLHMQAKDKPKWQSAKDNFEHALKRVRNDQEIIRQAIDTLSEHKRLTTALGVSQETLKVLENDCAQHNALVNTLKESQESLEEQIRDLTEVLITLKGRLGLFKRLFPWLFRRDPLVVRIKEMEYSLTNHHIGRSKIVQDYTQEEITLKQLQNRLKEQRNAITEQEAALERNQIKINKHRNIFGKNYADDNFWQDIRINEQSQLASPWTWTAYDQHREELFYYSLQLHKAFIVNSDAMRKNMNCLVNMWKNAFSVQDKKAAYKHLLNSLFLVVPVISSTLASVGSFLKVIGKEELAVLMIDEAGQATPWSSLGAWWRTRKSIVVGDPLQIEPVVTIPGFFMRKFATQYNIPKAYRPKMLSTQVLADTVNPFGGVHNGTDGDTWLGCPLMIHRRCVEPMFSISNAIAYDNRMFNHTLAPKDKSLLLSKSTWIDVKGEGTGEKGHFVPAQYEVVKKLVIDAFRLAGTYPNIYMITPFKAIATELKRNLKKDLRHVIPSPDEDYKAEELNRWLNSACGTIHTFQGKEADEVLLVLGCDAKRAGAARWAGGTPNILNVAVTRARYRIAIIGDQDVWKEIHHFDEAYEKLKDDLVDVSRVGEVVNGGESLLVDQFLSY